MNGVRETFSQGRRELIADLSPLLRRSESRCFNFNPLISAQNVKSRAISRSANSNDVHDEMATPRFARRGNIRSFSLSSPASKAWRVKLGPTRTRKSRNLVLSRQDARQAAGFATQAPRPIFGSSADSLTSSRAPDFFSQLLSALNAMHDLSELLRTGERLGQLRTRQRRAELSLPL